jgi:phosphoribosyl 1,2-cyclic phosphate phosphodiesterase
MTNNLQFIPLEIQNGTLLIYGYLFGNTAYITDAKVVPSKSLELLKGIEILIVNT